MKIIDIHTHVGDILFGTGLSHPYHEVPWTPGWITEITGYRTSSPPPGFRAISRYLEVIHNQQRNNMATITNLIKHSLPYGISLSVLQPIEPARKTDDNLACIAEYKSNWRMMLSESRTLDKIAEKGGLSDAALELFENAEPPLTIKTFASVHPKDPDKEKKLKRCDEAGCLGLKLHPIIQDLAPEDPAWMDVFEIWKSTGKPVLMHAGVSGYFMPRSPRDAYGEAARYERLIKAFPEVPVILAHMNMIKCETVWELARKYDNVYTDLSFHSAARIRQAKNRMGKHRLLFASDFPFTLPKYAAKAGMEASADDPEFRTLFFHDNAANLLGLSKMEGGK
jgi:predicted TIM-barrel fold metal-dependent hydrolase